MSTTDTVRNAERQAGNSGPPTCIVVAGMHRSGTSALTRMLNLLGCDIAASLMPADQHNERGYWEAPEIAQLNDDILEAVGSAWNDWQAFSHDWSKVPKRAEFGQRAVALLDELYSNRRLFVLKDPRICRLMPFWQSALSDFGSEVRVVLPLRSPLEVAASLHKRNGMNQHKAQLLWLRHVLDAELWSRDLQRTVVHYEDMIHDWRNLVSSLSNQLGVDFPISPETEVEIDAFISPGLRHHVANSKATLLNSTEIASPWFAEVRDVLRRGADTPAQQSRLDAVRSEFDSAGSSFGPFVMELERHGQYLKANLDELNESVLQSALHIKALKRERDQAQKDIQIAEEKLNAVHFLFLEATRSLQHSDTKFEEFCQGRKNRRPNAVKRLIEKFKRDKHS